MEERTGCFAIGPQPVFKRSCINLQISIVPTNDAMKRKKTKCVATFQKLHDHEEYRPINE